MNHQTKILTAANKKLVQVLLQETDIQTILGRAIIKHINLKQNPDILIRDLRELANDDPACMTKIIGMKAMALLKCRSVK